MKKKPKNQKAPQKIVVPPQPAPVKPSFLETGISLMEAKRYGQARPWLQKAVQEERQNPYAWYWYGMAYEKIGQTQQAQFFYARALNLDPAFPPFARVVTYPDDGSDHKALWDPLRPAKVYSVETTSRGVMIIPPGAPAPEATRRPAPVANPMLPKAPVYVPPEPTRSVVSSVVSSDAERLPVYAPPSFPGLLPVFGDMPR